MLPKNDSVKILLIEDDEGDIVLFKEMLELKPFFKYSLHIEKSLLSGLNSISEHPADIVLLDLGLPDSSGIETFTKFNEKHPLLPIIILSGLNDELKSLELIKQGAQDYLVKGKYTPDMLIKSINYSIERNRIEFELVEARKHAEESDRLKSAFLANMSHEIRTPMNGIMGFSNLLKKADLNSETQREYINIIQQSGKRMLNTINDLIDISRIESGQVKIKKSNVNFNEQLKHLYQFFKPETDIKHLNLTYNTPIEDKNALIYTDEEKFFAIMSNFLKNSIKYTKEGSISFGYALKNDQIEFFVKDTGIGISKDKQAQVFERFIQADLSITKPYEGFGLGLAISKAFAELIDGDIGVESTLGVGSTFFLRLPYKNPDLQYKNNTQTSVYENEKTITKDLNILLVEDDDISVLFMKSLLKNKYNSLLIAHTGTEAVDLAIKHPELDLILMDVRMPHMDGYSATRKIREFNKDVIILAQTAYAMESDQARAIEAGCDGYITKPINEQKLFVTIKELQIKKDQK